MKRTAVKILSVVFGALLLFAPLFGVASEIDLSRPGSEHNRVESRADVLEFLIGESVSSEERDYLNSLSGDGILTVTYDGGIPSSSFSAIFDSDNNEISVYAKPYSYFTLDSREVTWLPGVAVAEGKEASFSLFSDGVYYALLSGVDGSVDGTVTVKYTLDITITPDMASSLVNRAYNDAPRIKEAYSLACREHAEAVKRYGEYLAELEDYNERLSSYEKYVREYEEYSEALLAYNNYLEDLREYDRASEAYAEYLVALSEYEKNCSLYADYLNKYKIYSAEYEKYNTYISTVTPYRSQLAAVNFANETHTKLKRSARKAINGNMVNQVLEQRDLLESSIVNAPATVIDMAGDATERLRVLMEDYFALETEEARYAYYAAYYTDFRDNFVNLFVSLDYLYRIGPIRAYIYDSDKEEKYRILLVELYYISTALSDTPIKSVPKNLVAGTNGADNYEQFVYDSSTYRTYDRYYAKDVLDGACLVDTNKASPFDDPFPVEVKEPTAPTPVSEPKRPTAVQPPHKVLEVENPGEAPEPVADPGNAPEAVPAPGTEPSLTLEEQGVVAAYEAGKLSFCTETFTNDTAFVLEHNVSKRFVNPTFATVTFMDSAGNVLYSVTVDSGSVVLYEGAVPVRDEDERATYQFVGWVDAEGNAVSLDAVSSDLLLYPAFKEELKKYTVTAVVDGERSEFILTYGEIPPLPDSPEKPDDGLYKYPFVGWDKDISPVTGNAEYTAIFGREYLIPMSGGGATLTVSDGVPTADYSAGFDSEFLITELLTRAHPKQGAHLVTRYAKINLPPPVVKELSELGAARLKLAIAEGLGSYSYTLSAFDAAGRLLATTKEAKISLSAPLEYNERLRVYTVSEDGTRSYARFDVNDGLLSFSLSLGDVYLCEYEYRVISASSDLVTVKVEGNAFSAGSSVGVEVIFDKTLRLSRLYYRDSRGVETELTSTRFTMPSDDIVLYAEVDYVRYKITFVFDGRAVRTLYCLPGELPDIPEAPKKLGEKGYGYTFVGWSPEVVETVGDATYTAVFERYEIPSGDDEPVTDSQRLVGYIVAGAAVAIILVAAGVVIFKRRY